MNLEARLGFEPCSETVQGLCVKLPTDENMPGQSLIAGRGGAGRFFAAETRTSRSHVTILLKIYLTDCTL